MGDSRKIRHRLHRLHRLVARASSRPSQAVDRELQRLQGRATEPALTLAAAIARARGDHLEPDERRLVDAIEGERTQQCRSQAPVSWKAGQQVPLRRIVRRACQPRAGGVLLLCLVRAFRPQQALELGTCAGLSAAYQGAGLQLNGTGELVTLEAYPDLAAHATELWKQLQLTRIRVAVGRFDTTLPDHLVPGVDYAFVDGAHHGPQTYAHFRAITAVARPGALVIFDDIAWSPEMAYAWARIRDDPKVTEYATTGTVGIVVLAGPPNISPPAPPPPDGSIPDNRN